MFRTNFLRVIITVSLLFISGLASLSCTLLPPKLSTESQPNSGGNITPTKGSYDNGVEVAVTATAAPGYRFDHWEGSASGTAPNIRLTMNGSKKVIAFFKKVYTLAVSTTPTGGGTVSPGSRTYDEGQSVTLIATPSQYYKFNGWAGDSSGSSDHLTITMNSDKNIVASFIKNTFSLQASVGTTGGGTIEPNSGNFEAGAPIKVTAIPTQGYRFNKWEGSATSTANPLNLLMDTNKTLTAFFTRIFNLNTSVNPNGSGIVTANPASGPYDQGSTVTLSATADFPYNFKNWTGTDNDNANPTTVTMNSDKLPVVYFSKLNAGTLQVKSGTIYNDGNPMPTIPLKAGQWVEGGVSLTGVNPNTQLTILDPYSAVVQDLGVTSNRNFRFQATKDGDYKVVIKANFVYSIGYTVSYTIYS